AARAGRYPVGSAFGFLALLHQVYPTRELVCAAPAPTAMLRTVTGKYAPELSVLLKRPGDETLAAFAPFTRVCVPKDGKPTYYLCTDGSCSLPFTEE
ncbi:MAG: hypothetical protein J5927_07845, partial [Oscillospiraceae bacterium]|nr:hypothetical protein [Oscillospiraceae bacterium]